MSLWLVIVLVSMLLQYLHLNIILLFMLSCTSVILSLIDNLNLVFAVIRCVAALSNLTVLSELSLSDSCL